MDITLHIIDHRRINLSQFVICHIKSAIQGKINKLLLEKHIAIGAKEN